MTRVTELKTEVTYSPRLWGAHRYTTRGGISVRSREYESFSVNI